MSFPALTELRTKTQKLHSQLERESGFSDLMKVTVSYDQYVSALKNLHYFLSMLEPSIASHLSDDEYLYQRRLWCVERDLASLNGLTYPTIEPTDLTYHEAIGAAYVIEGSTLGGKLLYKRLQKQDFIAKASALSYFSFYRKNTWSDYIWWLEKQSFKSEAIDSICLGATHAFELLLECSSKGTGLYSANREYGIDRTD